MLERRLGSDKARQSVRILAGIITMRQSTTNILPEHFQAAAEAAEIGVWDNDLTSGKILLSATCRKLFGITQDGAYGFPELFRHIHPDDIEAFGQRVAEATDPVLRKPYDNEYRIIDPETGKVLRWLRSKGRASFDNSGLAYRFNGIVTDISHRKQVEEKLQQSVSEFRLLADSLPQVVWTARPDGYVDYWNKRWYELVGLEGEGDESWVPVVHPDDAQHVQDAWQESLRNGNSYRIEARLFDRNRGEYRWHLGMAFPVLDQQGQITKWFGTNTDIHEHKLAAVLLEGKVAERTAQLERSNRELEQFAYIASHDLQEPLRKIRTFISMVEERYGSLTEEQILGYLDRVKSSAQRMSNLVHDLLNLSRTTQADAQWQTTDLNTVVQQVTGDLDLMISQRSAKVKCSPLPIVQGIPLQLNQLFYNLIQNAIKFAHPGTQPQVVVDCCVAGADAVAAQPGLNPAVSYHRITVADNGIGFDPDHSERIFGMFQRLQSRNTYEGTGIGLALCKKVVDNHRGWIGAQSQPGSGTVITVLLPAAQL